MAFSFEKSVGNLTDGRGGKTLFVCENLTKFVSISLEKGFLKNGAVNFFFP